MMHHSKMFSTSFTPVLLKKSTSPAGWRADAMSQLMSPSTAPAIAPVVIAMPVRRRQNSDSVIGITAEPITTPMNMYTQLRLTCSASQCTPELHKFEYFAPRVRRLSKCGWGHFDGERVGTPFTLLKCLSLWTGISNHFPARQSQHFLPR